MARDAAKGTMMPRPACEIPMVVFILHTMPLAPEALVLVLLLCIIPCGSCLEARLVLTFFGLLVTLDDFVGSVRCGI